jgi:hypothetical protein
VLHDGLLRRCLSLILCSSTIAQAQAPPADGASAELPKPEKFDPSLIDKTKDPCTDFYQYTCSKWIAAHPIPPDLPASSVLLPLYLYNQTILRNAMEKAASDKQAHGSEPTLRGPTVGAAEDQRRKGTEFRVRNSWRWRWKATRVICGA